MSLRIIETNIRVDPHSFEPILWFRVKKKDTVIFDTDFLLTYLYVEETLHILNSLLVEHGEPPLTTEEIVLYKLTKDYP
jgi:hypothetical protein